MDDFNWEYDLQESPARTATLPVNIPPSSSFNWEYDLETDQVAPSKISTAQDDFNWEYDLQEQPQQQPSLAAQRMQEQARQQAGGLMPAEPKPQPKDSFLGDVALAGKVIGQGLYSALVDILPKTLAEAWKGGNVSVSDAGDWVSQYIATQKQDLERWQLTPQEQENRLFGIVKAQDVLSGLQNLGYSGATAIGGAAAGAAAATVISPTTPGLSQVVGGALGAGLATAPIAYRATKNQFVTDMRDKLLRANPNMTETEWQEKKALFEKDAQLYALWEAAPEIAGNMIVGGIIKLPVGQWLTGMPFIKQGIARTLAQAGVKVAMAVPAEVGTETITQYGQEAIQYRRGLQEQPPTIGGAFRTVLAPTIVTTLATLGFGALSNRNAMNRADIPEGYDVVVAKKGYDLVDADKKIVASGKTVNEAIKRGVAALNGGVEIAPLAQPDEYTGRVYEPVELDDAMSRIDILKADLNKKTDLSDEERAGIDGITLSQRWDREVEFANLIGAMTGKKVVITKGLPFNGAVQVTKDTVFVDERTEQPLVAALGHELSHAFDGQEFEATGNIIASAEEILRNAVDASVIASRATEANTTEDKIWAEARGDIIGQAMTTKEFWVRVRDQSPSLLQKMYTWIVNLVAKFQTAFSKQYKDTGISKDVTGLFASKDAMDQAFKAASDVFYQWSQSAQAKEQGFMLGQTKALVTTARQEATRVRFPEGVTKRKELVRMARELGVKIPPSTKELKTRVEKAWLERLVVPIPEVGGKPTDFLYHGTTQGALRQIVSEGLNPTTMGQISLADTEEYAKSYADRKGGQRGIILRIKRTSQFEPDTRISEKGDYVSKEKIAPENIEVKMPDGTWESLKKVDVSIGIPQRTLPSPAPEPISAPLPVTLPSTPIPPGERAEALLKPPTGEGVPPVEEGVAAKPAEIEPVKIAELGAKMAEGRRESNIKMAEQKNYMLAEMDKAIESATGKGYVTIDVPGDGTFKLLNSKDVLEKFRKVIKTRFPSKEAPPSIPRTYQTLSLEQNADMVIQRYGEAGKAADIIEQQAQNPEYTESQKKGFATLVAMLRDRAYLTTDPQDQTTERISVVRKEIESGQYAEERSTMMQEAKMRKQKALVAMAQHLRYPELYKAIQDKGIAIPEDGDLLNVSVEGRGAPTIRELQDTIGKDIGLSRDRPSKRFRGTAVGIFDLERYWKDIAEEYVPEKPAPEISVVSRQAEAAKPAEAAVPAKPAELMTPEERWKPMPESKKTIQNGRHEITTSKQKEVIDSGIADAVAEVHDISDELARKYPEYRKMLGIGDSKPSRTHSNIVLRDEPEYIGRGSSSQGETGIKVFFDSKWRDTDREIGNDPLFTVEHEYSHVRGSSVEFSEDMLAPIIYRLHHGMELTTGMRGLITRWENLADWPGKIPPEYKKPIAVARTMLGIIKSEGDRYVFRGEAKPSEAAAPAPTLSTERRRIGLAQDIITTLSNARNEVVVLVPTSKAKNFRAIFTLDQPGQIIGKNTRFVLPEYQLDQAKRSGATLDKEKTERRRNDLENAEREVAAVAVAKPTAPAEIVPTLSVEQAVEQGIRVKLPVGTLRVKAVFENGQTAIVRAQDMDTLAGSGKIKKLIPLQAKDVPVKGAITLPKKTGVVPHFGTLKQFATFANEKAKLQTAEDMAQRAEDKLELSRRERTPRAIPSISEPVRNEFAKFEDAQAKLYKRRSDREVRVEADAKIAQTDEDTLLKEMAGGKLDISDTGALVAQKVFSSDATINRVLSDDVNSRALVVTAMAQWYATGRKVARYFRMRRDPVEGPQMRREALLSMLASPSDSELRGWDGLTAEQKAIIGMEQATRMPTLINKLNSLGVDLSTITDEQLMDDELFGSFLREVQTQRAARADKIYEYWRNSILSGPLTNIVNAVGNLVSTEWEFFVQRPAEALFNTMLHKEGAPTFESLKAMYRMILPSMAEAHANLLKSWSTEQSSLEGLRIEERGVAIKGKLGRIIRVPQRGMAAIDDWFKTIIRNATRADYAIREANKMGYTGQERADFIRYSMTNPGSQANIMAIEEAKRLTWQSEPMEIGKIALQARKSRGALGFLFKYMFPFVTTPTNIIATGLRKSPLGLINMTLKGLVGGQYKAEGGKAMLLRDATEQILAYSTLGLLYGFTAGDDDEPPFITGSVSSLPAKRRFEYTHLPPQSIRIGDTWYSYSRIEPFATIFTTTVDAMNTWRKLKAGKTQGVGDDIRKSLMSNVRDKTFLQTLGDVIRALEDGEHMVGIVQNFAASWMPNIVRQSLRATDPYVRDYRMEQKGWEKTKEMLKQTGSMTLPVAPLQPMPRYDYWGKPASKDAGMAVFGAPTSDIIWRLVVPIRAQKTNTMNNIDRMIWNWNRMQTERTKIWWPVNPRNTYKLFPKDEDTHMTPEVYERFLKLRGERAWNLLKNRSFNFDSPKEHQIDLTRNMFEKATGNAKEQIVRELRQQYWRTQPKTRIERTTINGMRVL